MKVDDVIKEVFQNHSICGLCLPLRYIDVFLQKKVESEGGELFIIN